MGTFPIPGPLRIRLGSDFSLATGATGITPRGQATGGVTKDSVDLGDPGPGHIRGTPRVPMKPGIPGSGIPVGSRNLGQSPPPARVYWLLGPLCGP